MPCDRQSDRRSKEKRLDQELSPMVFAINCGNTHVVFGCVDQDGSVEQMLKLPTDLRETAVGYAARIKQSLELVGADIDSD